MKMTDADLLTFLQEREDSAERYIESGIRRERETATRDYLRRPYGTEVEGRSQVVTSDVFDAVEGMLPDLVDVFVSSDRAVVFEPVGPEDAESADQATDACNYVFYKQNNGFLTLYTAIKDGLLHKTGAVKWWWDTGRRATFQSYTTDEMQLAVYLATNPKAEVVEKEEVEPNPEEVQQYQMQAQQAAMMGQELPPLQKRLRVKIKTVEKTGQVRVAAIPPHELYVTADAESPLLSECPYVAHVCERTLSQLRDDGFDVQPEDMVDDSHDEEYWFEKEWDDENADPAQRLGTVREEYVRVDFDGDGIAEQRRIVRLKNKILENYECSHVQIAAWSPYIITHRPIGLSVADLLTDMQRVSTDVMRAQLDSLDLANNQETVVLTDSAGNPMADLDDLLNRRPGGIIRERMQGAVRPYVDQWRGIEAMPMLEIIENRKESRTGYTRYNQGMDAESLNKTATGITRIMNATQKRMRLMARIAAECLVAPMFRGIFKLLTDYGMQPISARINGRFVQYDPQEWRDGYDMTINVGLGTGDTQEQMQYLNMIAQAQFAMLPTPLGGRVVNEQNIYRVQARIAEKAGFKNPNEFWTDPTQIPPPQPQQDPQAMKVQAEMQMKQADMQIKMQTAQAELQSKQQTSQIELEKARVELQIKQADLELRRQALELKAQEAMLDAQIAQQRAAMHASDDMARAEQIRSE